jgi:metallo-beta-lactamase class B
LKYVIVTHGHNDHFAGAGRIKQATGARIAMSAADWTLVERAFAGPAANNGVPFSRDMVIDDGETLTLGDTTLKFHVLPGHTPGNVGTEIRARAGANTYRALVGLAFAPAPGLTAASIKTTERLKQLGPWDALLTSHSYLAPVPIPLTAREIFMGVAPPSAKRQTAHPAVAGADYINNYFDTILTAVRERLAREQASAPPPR